MNLVQRLKFSSTVDSQNMTNISEMGYSLKRKPSYLRSPEEDRLYHDYWIQRRLTELYGPPTQKKFVKSSR